MQSKLNYQFEITNLTTSSAITESADKPSLLKGNSSNWESSVHKFSDFKYLSFPYSSVYNGNNGYSFSFNFS